MFKMTFLHAARAEYDPQNNHMSWQSYLEWSKLTHLTELVSLDSMLNEDLVDIDRDSDVFWDNVVVVNQYETGFYSTISCVLQHVNSHAKFNLLSLIIEPENDCALIHLDDYDFLGYELLDCDFGISALTNCGGFDNTFSPTDINQYGLITDFAEAVDIKKRLRENNPEEHHADTCLIAVWRHRLIGKGIIR